MIVDTLFIELAPRGPAASLCGAHLPLSVVTAVRFERSPFPQEPAGVRAPPRRAGELLRVLLMPNRYRVIFYSLEEVYSSSYSSFSSASSSISAVFFLFLPLLYFLVPLPTSLPPHIYQLWYPITTATDSSSSSSDSSSSSSSYSSYSSRSSTSNTTSSYSSCPSFSSSSSSPPSSSAKAPSS